MQDDHLNLLVLGDAEDVVFLNFPRLVFWIAKEVAERVVLVRRLLTAFE